MRRSLAIAALGALLLLAPSGALATEGYAMQGRTEHGGSFTLVPHHDTLAPWHVYIEFRMHCLGGTSVKRSGPYWSIQTLGSRQYRDANGVRVGTARSRIQAADGTKFHIASRVVVHSNGVLTSSGTFTASATVHGHYCDTGVVHWHATSLDA